MLSKGFYHDFSTKKASASGDKLFPGTPTRGAAPWTPEVSSPHLKIYPGAAPVSIHFKTSVLSQKDHSVR